MDLQGSLIDTNLKIYPTKNLIKFVQSISIDDDVPLNIIRLVKGTDYTVKKKQDLEDTTKVPIHLNTKDLENLNKIKDILPKENAVNDDNAKTDEEEVKKAKNNIEEDEQDVKKDGSETEHEEKLNKENEKSNGLHLVTADIDWLYTYLRNKKKQGKDVPYLHVLLEGADIKPPDNEVLKRNPVLEARCVKLRAQEEARQYRKMTKTVDNVRMKFPEDSIAYQMKQLNRQLIAIGQFILSIFAGFLFGFRGVEWMVGNLDFGFRLLLGVMCALVIALAEIYFLAKKLNEELSVPETVQLGGPPKFADQPKSYLHTPLIGKAVDKEHLD